MKKIILILLVLCLSGVSITAIETDFTYFSKYYSPELLAQGGVTGVAATGVDALFINPAGMARENEIRLIAPKVGPYINFSPMTISAIQDVLTGGGAYEDPDPDSDEASGSTYEDGYRDGYRDAGEGFLGFITPEKIRPILKTADYKNGIGGHYGVSAGATYFGIGAGGYFSSDMLFEKTSLNSNVDFTYISEVVLAAGISHKLSLEVADLYVGVSANKIWQTVSEKTITEEEVEGYVNGTYNMGDTPAILREGFALNAGAILQTGPVMISLHMNNIGSVAIRSTQGTLHEALNIGIFPPTGDENPTNQTNMFIPHLTGETDTARYPLSPLTMTVGVGFQQDFGKILGIQAAADYRYVFDDGDPLKPIDDPTQTIWKNVHVGGEVELLQALSVRAGLNQGYFTAGAGLKFVKFFNLLEVQFNGTYYARELGSFAGHRQGEAMLFDVVFTL